MISAESSNFTLHKLWHFAIGGPFSFYLEWNKIIPDIEESITLANYTQHADNLFVSLPQVCYKRDWHDLIAKGNNVLGDAIPITAAKASRNIASDVSKCFTRNLDDCFFKKYTNVCLHKWYPIENNVSN